MHAVPPIRQPTYVHVQFRLYRRTVQRREAVPYCPDPEPMILRLVILISLIPLSFHSLNIVSKLTCDICIVSASQLDYLSSSSPFSLFSIIHCRLVLLSFRLPFVWLPVDVLR